MWRYMPWPGLDSPPRDADTRRAMEPMVCKLSSLLGKAVEISIQPSGGLAGTGQRNVKTARICQVEPTGGVRELCS